MTMFPHVRIIEPTIIRQCSCNDCDVDDGDDVGDDDDDDEEEEEERMVNIMTIWSGCYYACRLGNESSAGKVVLASQPGKVGQGHQAHAQAHAWQTGLCLEYI